MGAGCDDNVGSRLGYVGIVSQERLGRRSERLSDPLLACSSGEETDIRCPHPTAERAEENLG